MDLGFFCVLGLWAFPMFSRRSILQLFRDLNHYLIRTNYYRLELEAGIVSFGKITHLHLSQSSHFFWKSHHWNRTHELNCLRLHCQWNYINENYLEWFYPLTFLVMHLFLLLLPPKAILKFHTWILFKCLWLIKWTMILYLGHLQDMVHQDKLHKDQLF